MIKFYLLSEASDDEGCRGSQTTAVVEGAGKTSHPPGTYSAASGS